MLNPLEQKLADALVSDEYKDRQAQRQLRDGDKFCCLGVLCNISGLGRWLTGDFDSNTFQTDNEDERGLDNEESVLPMKVQHAIGWHTSDAMLTFRDRDGFWPTLADMNDQGLTFPQIADLIRAGLVRRQDEKLEG